MAHSFKTADEYVAGILDQDRMALSRAITLIESTRKDHQELASEIVSQCLPHIGNGLRIGITGPPGAGKSTFIDALGTRVANQGKKVAVLAIDPSSKKSKGSILGDKTRMTRLATHPNAFIRPSPNSGATGGLATKTREAMILCEAAGFGVLLIETVGVGQSEFEVHSMVDMLVLLLITGAGDEIQGIKRGVMEMADLIVINKADANNAKEADLLRRSLKHILQLMPAPRPDWSCDIIATSSLEGTGIDAAWELIQSFFQKMQDSGYQESNRKAQSVDWMLEKIQHELAIAFNDHEDIKTHMEGTQQQVMDGLLSPTQAAEYLLSLFLKDPSS